ncbi:MAG: PAS domain-containing sensor histidine kinase, partial [Anaerolineae bacterium]|nr:PAS domain-containing sensor histidine kinase [Anaerolineae bacterium]
MNPLLHENLLAAVPVPLLIIQPSDKTVLYANPAFDSAYNAAAVLKTLQTLDEAELVLTQPDGSITYARISGQPVLYHGSDALMLVFQDITTQKKNEERARALTSFISDYTYSYRVDAQGHLTREGMSEAFEYMTGYPPTEKDMLPDLDSLVYPDDAGIASQQVQDALAGYAGTQDFRIVTRTGEVRWLRNYLYPVQDSRNRVIRLYGMAQDTTYHKKAEEAFLTGTAADIAYRLDTEAKLRNYAAELEAVNRELDAYSYTIAHDLKAPLSGILGFVELMEYFLKTDLEKAQKYASRVRESAEYMTRMVSQLLMLAKLRNAEETVEKVDVASLLKSVMIRFADPLEKENVQILIADSIPPAMGHAPWIEEVFANFINNAIKYKGDNNPAPRIQIRGSVQGDE